VEHAAIEVPVVVVGAGPVGLSMAVALRDQGVECQVLERHDSTLDFPKGRRITVRSVEILRQWGLEPAVAEASMRRDESLFVFEGDTLLGPEFRRRGRPIEETDTSPTNELICSQEVLEPILVDQARARGADVRFSHEVAGFAADGGGVTVRVLNTHSGDETVVRAAYLVAADGSRSRTRAALEIPQSVLGDLGARISVLVEADLASRVADRASALYVLGQPPPGVTFAAVDNRTRWLLMTAYDPAVTPPAWFSDTRCVELAETGIGDPTVAVRFIGRRFWQAVAAVADRFSVGRVFLAGDAAHVTTPVGGLGMNCGIGDAHNLGWKLAGVLQGWAHARLLNSYETERRPVALACAEASLGAARPPKRIDGLVLGSDYTSPVIVDDATPPPRVSDPVADYVPTARPGGRAPHLWIDDSPPRRSVIDLFGRELVALTDANGAKPLDAATQVVRATGVPIRAQIVDAPGWRECYGVHSGGVVVVRPDGHVAFRSASTCTPENLASAVEVATGHRPAPPHPNAVGPSRS
jgi:putative polyketide hydroxylase